MIRGTSVPMVLRVVGDMMVGVSSVKVSLKQNDYVINKMCAPVTSGNDAIITVPLTVEETLGFVHGIANVQITWLTVTGKQQKTLMASFKVLETIDEEELEIEEEEDDTDE